MDINDYQNCVDEIRRCLAIDGVAESMVKDANSQFAEAIQEVNVRLRNCDKLLKQNQASEAIRQCGLEPNLLDSVEILDLAEKELWSALLTSYAIPTGEPLFWEVAAGLNEAYALLQPLESQLRRHRLLAIAKSPLRLRLATLHQLAILDPENRIWGEDLEVFERERCKQLATELQRVIDRRNLAAIEALQQEILTTKWIEPPPEKLSRQAAEAVRKIIRKQNYRALEETVRLLDEAWKEQSYPVPAQELKGRWDELRQQCPLAEDDPVVIAAQPALEWLGEMDAAATGEREATTSSQRIERLLNEAEGLQRLREKVSHNVKLDRLLPLATQGDYELPTLMQTRIKTFKENLKRALWRRFLIRLSTLCAVILIAIAGVIWIAGSISQEATTKELVAAVRKPFTKKQWGDAEHAYSALPPDVKALPEVESMKKKIDANLAKDAKQDAKLQQEITAAKKKSDNAIEAANAALEEATYSNPQPLVSAESALKKVKQNLDEVLPAAQGRDRARLQAKLTEIQQSIKQVTARVNELFSQRFAELTRKYTSLSGGASSASEKIDGYKALLQDLRAFKKVFMNHAAYELTQTIGPFEDKVKSKLDEHRDYEQFTASLRGLKNRLSDSSRYRKALQQIVDNYPPSYTEDLQMVIKEDLPVWDSVEGHSRLMMELKKMSGKSSYPAEEDLAKWLASAQAFHRRHGKLSDSDRLEDEIGIYSKIAKRSQLHSDMVRKLASQCFAKAELLKDAKGKEYFVTGVEKLKSGRLKIKKVINLQGQVMAEIVPGPSAGRSPAGHRVVASKLSEQLDSMPKEGYEVGQWEDTVWQMLGNLYRDKTSNPVVKQFLVANILKMGMQGSPSLEEVFESLPPGALWFDDTLEFFGQNEKDDATQNLDRIKKKISKKIKAEKQLRDQIKNREYHQYGIAGYLCTNSSGDWTVCGELLADAEDGALYVPGVSASSGKLVPIGTVRGGRVQFSSNSKKYFMVGRPVFVEF